MEPGFGPLDQPLLLTGVVPNGAPGGVIWALAGAFSAIVVVRKQDAFRGDYRG